MPLWMPPCALPRLLAFSPAFWRGVPSRPALASSSPSSSASLNSSSTGLQSVGRCRRPMRLNGMWTSHYLRACEWRRARPLVSSPSSMATMRSAVRRDAPPATSRSTRPDRATATSSVGTARAMVGLAPVRLPVCVARTRTSLLRDDSCARRGRAHAESVALGAVDGELVLQVPSSNHLTVPVANTKHLPHRVVNG